MEGNFLSGDVLYYVLGFLSLKDISNLLRVSKRISHIVNNEKLWKSQFYKTTEENHHHIAKYISNKFHVEDINTFQQWRLAFQQLPSWKWNVERKAPEIEVSVNKISARRNETTGRNPAILSRRPLTRLNSSFRVQIKRLGTWIGIGVADENFVFSNGGTLGTQATMNSAYFWQNNNIKKLQMYLEPSNTEVMDIREGDFIDVVVDFNSNMTSYYNNGKLQGILTSNNFLLVEGSVYPCVNLSHNTEVQFRNNDIPILSTNYEWRFGNSPNKKADSISISKDGKRASRKSPKGMNPAVISVFPINQENNQFRVEIHQLGNWLGIGVCDNNFILNDSKTLGRQTDSVNASYFHQNTGINKISMFGETPHDVVEPFRIGDFIDVMIDFNKNRVYFFNNMRLQWFFSPSINLKEGTLYPCIAMATGAKVEIRDDKPKLNLCKNWDSVVSKNPTMNWSWSLSKKASFIEISQNSQLAKRLNGGSNPVTMTDEPLTKKNNYFLVRIVSVGQWIGIGLADSNFVLSGGQVLGAQAKSINCAYFRQGCIKKIQMYGELEITDGILSLEQDDIIGIRVDFDENRIYFYNNDLIMTTINPKVRLLENQLYPCINLAHHSEVKLINQF